MNRIPSHFTKKGINRKKMSSSKSCFSVIGLLLLISIVESSICSSAAIAKSRIEFPAGWDDSVIDLVKEGKSTKKIVAVLDFEGSNQLPRGAKLSEMLVTALAKTNRFEIVERNKLESVIAEQNLALAGVIDESTAAQVGNLLGAQYVILGSVSSVTKDRIDKFGYILVEIKVGIDVRAVNTTTGQLLLSESAQGVSASKEIRTADGTLVQGALDDASAYSAASREAMEIVSGKIALLSPLIGYVIDVDGKKLTIDVGEDKGVQKGERFVVFRAGEEIKHPVTGKRIGWKKEILRMIEVTRTEKNMSIGITKEIAQKVDVIPSDLVISVK